MLDLGQTYLNLRHECDDNCEYALGLWECVQSYIMSYYSDGSC